MQNLSTVARRRDLLARGHTPGSLRSALKHRQIERVSRDLYSIAAAADSITERHSYVEAAKLVPHGVFCLISALVFHALTTQVNQRMQIALPRPAFEPKVPFLDVQYLHLSKAPFEYGVEEHLCEGAMIKVYSPAKTVADMFKFRNKLGTDLALEALREVWRLRTATVAELDAAARVCRVDKIMKPYLEATVT